MSTEPNQNTFKLSLQMKDEPSPTGKPIVMIEIGDPEEYTHAVVVSAVTHNIPTNEYGASALCNMLRDVADAIERAQKRQMNLSDHANTGMHDASPVNVHNPGDLVQSPDGRSSRPTPSSQFRPEPA